MILSFHYFFFDRQTQKYIRKGHLEADPKEFEKHILKKEIQF